MSSSSLKQKAVLATLGVLAAYAVIAAMWFLNLDRKMGWCPKSWGDAIRAYEKACKTYKDECKLISQKQKWADSYEDEKKAMPSFATGKATDTTWQRKLDEVAAKHFIEIHQSQAGKETAAGEVLELPIEVKSWEGALVSLVKFMHELENTEDGMFDIRQINMKPSAKRGYLKGSFVLTCAYMRGE